MAGDVPDNPDDAHFGVEHRRATRRAVTVQAQLRDSNNERFHLSLVDLSQTGFRAVTMHRLWVGAVVWITIPGLSALQAIVAREGDREYGCVFAHPLYPAVFDHITSMFQPVAAAVAPAPAPTPPPPPLRYPPRPRRRLFQ